MGSQGPIPLWDPGLRLNPNEWRRGVSGLGSGNRLPVSRPESTGLGIQLLQPLQALWSSPQTSLSLVGHSQCLVKGYSG